MANGEALMMDVTAHMVVAVMEEWFAVKVVMVVMLVALFAMVIAEFVVAIVGVVNSMAEFVVAMVEVAVAIVAHVVNEDFEKRPSYRKRNIAFYFVKI